MVKELKEITGVTQRTHLAIVRQTATQAQTIDVEIVKNDFSIRKINLDNFVRNVRIAPLVAIYGSAVNIQRPKINTFVIITQIDTNNWYVIITGESERYTLGSDDTKLKMNGTVYSVNSDIIRLNKIVELGGEIDNTEIKFNVSNIDMFIENEMKDKLIRIYMSNIISINAKTKTVDIGFKELNVVDEKDTLLQMINNNINTVAQLSIFDIMQIGFNASRSYNALIFDYIYWYGVNKDKSNVKITTTLLDEYTKQFSLPESILNYQNWYGTKNYKVFIKNYVGSTRYSNAVYNKLISKTLNMNIFSNNVKMKKYGKQFTDAITKGYFFTNMGALNTIYTTLTSALGQAIINITHNKPTSVTKTDIYTQFYNVIYKINVDLLYRYTQTWNDESVNLSETITSINDIIQILLALQESYKAILADLNRNVLSTSNNNQNLGNLFIDMCEKLQRLNLKITPSSTGSVEDGKVILLYYNNNKIQIKQILKTN